MIRIQRFLIDAQCALVERLRLGVLALHPKEQGEIV